MKKITSIIALALGACIGLSTFSGCDFLESKLRKTLQGEEAQKAYEEIVEAIEYSKAYNGSITIEVKGTGTDTEEYSEKVSVDPATGRAYFNTKSGDETTKGKLYKIDGSYYMHNNSDDGDSEFAYASAYEVNCMKSIYSRYVGAWVNYEAGDIAETNAIYEALFADAMIQIMSQADNSESIYYGMTYADGQIEISIEKFGKAYILKNEQHVTLKKGEEYSESKSFTEIKVKDGKVIGAKSGHSYELAKKDGNDEIRTNEYTYETDIKISYKFNELEYQLMRLYVEIDGEKKTFAKPEDILEFLGDDIEVPENQFMGEKDLYLNGGYFETAFLSGDTIEETLSEKFNNEGLNYKYYTDVMCTQELKTLEQFNACTAIYGVATPKEGYALINETFQVVMDDDVDAKSKVLLDMIWQGYFASNGIIDWQNFQTYEVVRLSESSAYEVEGFIEIFSGAQEPEFYLDGVLYEGATVAVADGQTYNVTYKQDINKAGVEKLLEENEINILLLFANPIL